MFHGNPLGGGPLLGGSGGEGEERENFSPIRDTLTAYTRNVPEPIQIVNPATPAIRFWDRNPGFTVRDPDDGPTDDYGDRRGPIDAVGDALFERGEIRDGNFEDDTDLPGVSVSEFLGRPFEGAADTVGQFQRAFRGDWDYGGDGNEPENPTGRGVGSLLLIGGAVLVVTFIVGQLFTFNIGVGSQ